MDYQDGLSSDEMQELFGNSDSDSNNEESLADIEDKDQGSHYISKFQSSMMLARFCVGSGLFSIPAAFRYSGIAVGIFWIFLNGFLTAYGMKKLVKLSMEISNRRGGSAIYYGDLGEECAKAVFNEESAKYGRILVDGVIAFTTFALLCTQILYMAAIWKQGFEQLGLSEMDIRAWILVVFLVLFPLFQIRRPDILATCSLLANVLTVVGTISIFVHIFSTRTFRVRTMLQPNTNKVHWSKLPLTIGITSYAVQLVAPLMVTVRNVMKEPKKSPFVINFVMAVVSVLYAFMGATGYASCYPNCKDSIILNLPGTWYYSVVKVLLGLSSCVGTALGVFICFAIVEPALKHLLPENRFLIASIVTRIFMLTLAAGITAAVPQLGNFMSLAGVLINPTVGFIFPAAAHIALFYKTLSRTNLAQDIALLFCGLLILVIGLYTSVYQIVHDFIYHAW